MCKGYHTTFLTTDELDRFHVFINLPPLKGSSLSISYIHGFISGIHCQPEFIMPSQWYPVLLGGEPRFDTKMDAIDFYELLNKITLQVREELRSHIPFNILVHKHDNKGKMLIAWCNGYLKAMQLSLHRWGAEPRVLTLLAPFLSLVDKGLQDTVFSFYKKNALTPLPFNRDEPFLPQLSFSLHAYLSQRIHAVYNIWKGKRDSISEFFPYAYYRNEKLLAEHNEDEFLTQNYFDEKGSVH